MKKHFVTFFSPGTFVPETTTRPIDSWNVDKAIEMAKTVTERYGAKPYGFQFSTRARSDAELDSKVSKSSGIYYLGGKIKTRDEILAGTDPKEDILRQNIEFNSDVENIIVNDNSWRFTGQFRADDVLLDVTL